MKASIVIANYNNGKFISECIDSLNSQTYKNIEIIFFDDNSSDNSIEIIEKFKNIKVVRNKIKTNFSTFNQMNAFKKSIEISTGEVIFFLDSDDFFHKEKVEKIINTFLKEKDKMIVFDYPIILEKNKMISQKKINKFLKHIGIISIRLAVFLFGKLLLIKFLKLLMKKNLKILGWILEFTFIQNI